MDWKMPYWNMEWSLIGGWEEDGTPPVHYHSVWIDMCVYIYKHVCLPTHIFLHMHIMYISIYIYIYIFTYMHACIHTHSYIHTYIHTYIHIHTYNYVYVCIYLYILNCLHTIQLYNLLIRSFISQLPSMFGSRYDQPKPTFWIFVQPRYLQSIWVDNTKWCLRLTERGGVFRTGGKELLLQKG